MICDIVATLQYIGPQKNTENPLSASLTEESSPPRQPSLTRQHERVQAAAQSAKAGTPTHYYDQCLILFGKGWLDGRYRFDDQGRLQPQWQR